MHGLVEYEDVVAAGGVFGVHTHRVIDACMAHIDVAERAVFTGEAEAPVPLLADGLELGRVLGNGDELTPDDQTWGKHGYDADRCDDREPGLELLVLWIVFRLEALAVAEVDDAIDEEEIDGDENDTRYNEGDIDCRIDHVPVRSDVGEPPAVERTDEMEDQRGDHQ